jgi:type I restriction enzyme S subunit
VSSIVVNPWDFPLPAGWQRVKLKFIATMKGRLGWQNLRADEYTTEGPFLVTSEHFANDQVDWDRCHHVSEHRYAMAPQIQLRHHDLLMMKDGAAMGKLAYVDSLPGPACLNSHLLLFRPDRNAFLNRFLYYVLTTPIFTAYMVQERTGSTFFGISQESMGSFQLSFPPVKEQAEIVDYLDHRTEQIDSLIGHKERLIALLEEKRQTVISHVVTRGLNPDAPLKDSGVPWLGMVPEHWEIKKLKHSVRFHNHRRIPLSAEERGGLEKIYPYYGASGIIDHVDRYIFDEPLILIGEDGANLLSRSTPLAFIATGKYWVNNHAHILKPMSGQLLYWSERLNSISYVPFVSGSAQPKLTIESLGSIEFAAPGAGEQAKIASFIGEQDAKIAPAIARVRDSIALLQENRTALISAAVTGQIDVRGEVTS